MKHVRLSRYYALGKYFKYDLRDVYVTCKNWTCFELVPYLDAATSCSKSEYEKPGGQAEPWENICFILTELVMARAYLERTEETRWIPCLDMPSRGL